MIAAPSTRARVFTPLSTLFFLFLFLLIPLQVQAAEFTTVSHDLYVNSSGDIYLKARDRIVVLHGEIVIPLALDPTESSYFLARDTGQADGYANALAYDEVNAPLDISAYTEYEGLEIDGSGDLYIPSVAAIPHSLVLESGATNANLIAYDIENVTFNNTFPVVGTDPATDAMPEPVYWGQLSGQHSVGNDGSFNYSISIEVPPGINGMQPNLSLSYNSNRRNGVVGWGWGIGGLSMISRCPASLVRDDRVSGINTGDDFEFCLDGQRLVEIASGEYRTESETFSRIYRYGTEADPTYWTVETKDGSAYWYGGQGAYGTSTQVEDGDGNNMTWYLGRKEDNASNAMIYHYDVTASGMHRIDSIEYGVSNTNEIEFIYEARDDEMLRYRAGAEVVTDERLAQIQVSNDGQLIREYSLNYQIYDGITYADPAKTSRLEEIELCYGSGTNCAEPIALSWADRSSTLADNLYTTAESNIDSYAGISAVTSYDNSELSVLTGYHDEKRQVGDLNGDLIPDYIITPTVNFGEDQRIYIHFADQIETVERPLVYDNYGWIDTSATTTQYKAEVQTLVSSPDSFDVTIVEGVVQTGYWREFDGNTINQSATLFNDDFYTDVLDFNSDGYPDVYVVDKKYGIRGMQVYLSEPIVNSNNRSFQYSSTYSLAASETSFDNVGDCSSQYDNTPFSFHTVSAYTIAYKDVNGDGQVDLLRYAPPNANPAECPASTVDGFPNRDGLNDLEVALNTGSGFTAFTNWGSLDSTFRRWVQVGDVNGDSLPDLIGYEGRVAINTGSGFDTSNSNWGQISNFYDTYDVHKGLQLTYEMNALDRVQDMNGDGLSDLVVFRDSGIRIYYSTGAGFSSDQLWASVPRFSYSYMCQNTAAAGDPYYITSYNQFYFPDINGDGLADLVMYQIDDMSGYAASTYGCPTYPYTDYDWNAEIAFSLGTTTSALQATSLDVSSSVATDVDENGSLGITDFYAALKTQQNGVLITADNDLDGMPDVEGINPFDANLLLNVAEESRTVAVQYDALGRGNIYSNSDSDEAGDALGALSSGSMSAVVFTTEFSDQFPNAARYHDTSNLVSRDRVGSRFGVASVEVSDGVGGEIVSNHGYADAKVHRSGYGNLGFASAEKTVSHANQSQSIKTVAEYLQDVDADADHDYRLIGQMKRSLTCVVDSASDDCVESGSGFNLLSDARNQWKVRLYDDDADTGYDSPHFFPYVYRSSTESWDLNGTKISDSLTQMENTGTSFSCSVLGLTNGDMDTEFTSSLNEDYSEYGTPLYRRTTACDQSGTDQDAVATAVENSNFVDITTGSDPSLTSDWIVGLVETTESYAYAASSLGGLAASEEVRTTEYDYYLSDSGDNKAGFLLSEQIEPGNSALSVTNTFTYNTYGSVDSIVETWSGGTRDTDVTETFASDGERTVTMINPLNKTETTIYEAAFGLPRLSTDINSLPTSTTYDAAGRIDTITFPDGTTSESDYRACSSAACFADSDYETWYLQTKTTGYKAIRSYFDAFGREVGTRSYDLTGTLVYTNQGYDAQGKVAYAFDPYYSTTAVNDRAETSFTFDVLGRSDVVTYADGTMSDTVYNGTSITLTNQLGQSQTRVSNGAGWVMRSTDNAGTPVDFTYTPWGDLETTEVNNNADTMVSITYDNLGRKTQLDDPNTGVIDYTYDPLGRLDYETNARGQRTDYDYDDLDRQIERIDDALASNPANRTQTWVYDSASGAGEGQLASVSGFNTDDTIYTETYTYDAVGRLTDVDTTIDGTTYTMETVYDDFSRIVGSVYPTGFGVRSLYNNNGYLQEVENAEDDSTLWFADDSDARGNLTQFTLGNGVVTDQTYDDEFGRIATIRAHNPSTNFEVQDHSYSFDSLGNLLLRSDTTEARSISEHFCYDNMNRLTAQDFGSNCGTADYAYDDYGNIMSRSGVTGSYSYGSGSAGPNAVTTVGTTTYSYDATGNLTGSNDGTSVQYTSYNKPTTIAKEGNSSTVVYDANQNRVKRTDSNGRATIYAGLGSYEETTIGGLTEKIHYLGDFGLYIMEEGGSDYYLYQHYDHIGSIVAKSDETIPTSENDLEWLANDPWGERLQGTWDAAQEGNDYVPLGNSRGFTDHEHLDGVGLIHMNGRVYDPTLARFMSPDPFVQAPYNTQSYNRYTYVFNNPLSFTDPSGFRSVCDEADPSKYAGRLSCIGMFYTEDSSDDIRFLIPALSDEGNRYFEEIEFGSDEEFLESLLNEDFFDKVGSDVVHIRLPGNKSKYSISRLSTLVGKMPDYKLDGEGSTVGSLVLRIAEEGLAVSSDHYVSLLSKSGGSIPAGHVVGGGMEMLKQVANGRYDAGEVGKAYTSGLAGVGAGIAITYHTKNPILGGVGGLAVAIAGEEAIDSFSNTFLGDPNVYNGGGNGVSPRTRNDIYWSNHRFERTIHEYSKHHYKITLTKQDR